MKVAVAFFVVCIAVSYAYPNGGQKKNEAKIQGIKYIQYNNYAYTLILRLSYTWIVYTYMSSTSFVQNYYT